MKKYLNFVLDIVLLLSGFASLAISYVVWFVLPHGMGLHGNGAFCQGAGVGIAGNSENFLGLLRYNWITIHNWASVVLAAIVITHIVFHWRWVVETSKRISTHLHRHTRKVLELYGAILVLFIFFVFECMSGLVLWLVLPRGARDYNQMLEGNGRTFLGLQRIVWSDLHAWIAVTIVSIIIIHVILNWSWVVGVSKRIFWRVVRPGY